MNALVMVMLLAGVSVADDWIPYTTVEDSVEDTNMFIFYLPLKDFQLSGKYKYRTDTVRADFADRDSTWPKRQVDTIWIMRTRPHPLVTVNFDWSAQVMVRDWWGR